MYMGSVSIKGTGSGIILELDENCSFEEIRTNVSLKFRESSSFLGRANVGLMIRGRVLSDPELSEIIRLIGENSKLTINCVLSEDPATDQLFERFAHTDNTAAFDNSETTDTVATEAAEVTASVADMIPGADFTKVHRGSLRSGQSITEKNSVIIMGDIKPGASVTSEGSIFILGALRGSAYAGAGGDDKAFVFALEMDPLQIRIANAIAISPDAEKGPKLKTRKFRKKATEKEAEIAYILNGQVVKDVYNVALVRGNRFF